MKDAEKDHVSRTHTKLTLFRNEMTTDQYLQVRFSAKTGSAVFPESGFLFH
jgi:hypothetical protein